MLLIGILPFEQTIAALAPSDVVDVLKMLEEFEKGKISLSQLTDDPKDRKAIIRYYLINTNILATKYKVVVGRCFALEERYEEAAGLARDYVRVYSNDWRGWRILGNSHFVLKSYGEAVAALTNAVILGDEECYAPLAAAAIAIGRLDLVKDIVPHLLILKKVDRTDQDDKLTILGVLTLYSLKAKERDVFLKGLEGFDAKNILTRRDVAKTVLLGCDEFGGQETQSICSKLREALSMEKN